MNLLNICREGRGMFSEARLADFLTQCRLESPVERQLLLACYPESSEQSSLLRRCRQQEPSAWQELASQAEPVLVKELQVCNLITKCQEGDADACVELAHGLEPKIKGLLAFRSYRLKEEDIQDLCQEALLKIFRALPDYDARKGSLETFWRQQVDRIFTDHVRRSTAIKRKPAGDLLSIEESAENDTPLNLRDASHTPVEGAAQNDEFRLLYEALEQLGSNESRCRQLFELFYFDDRTYDEIASQLAMNAKTVSTALVRCREKLMQYFPQEYWSKSRDPANRD